MVKDEVGDVVRREVPNNLSAELRRSDLIQMPGLVSDYFAFAHPSLMPQGTLGQVYPLSPPQGPPSPHLFLVPPSATFLRYQSIPIISKLLQDTVIFVTLKKQSWKKTIL
jgi:hypothetical protein